MDPILGGLIAGGASLLGNVFSSNTSAENTQAQLAAQQNMLNQSEQFNASQTQQQEQFQQQMSNTAYQRASKDMTAAGLNPMMMFGSGSAASTPSGAAASVGTPSVPMPQRTSPLAGLGDVVGKALSTASGIQQMTKTAADIDSVRADTHATNERALNTSVDTINKGASNDLIKADVASKQMDNVIKQVGATTARNVESGIDPSIRKGLDVGGFSADKIGKMEDAAIPLASTAKAIKKGLMGQRSTVERSSTGPSGDTSSFEERFHY